MAKGTIKKGMPVSIALSSELTDADKQNALPQIVQTNNTIHKWSVGL
jgi:hypothetical protein